MVSLNIVLSKENRWFMLFQIMWCSIMFSKVIWCSTNVGSYKHTYIIYIYTIYLETQMTLVLIGKGLVLGGWPSKIEVIGVLGMQMCLDLHILHQHQPYRHKASVSLPKTSTNILGTEGFPPGVLPKNWSGTEQSWALKVGIRSLKLI